MKNTCVNISGKLPIGLVELYKDIDDATNQLGIPYLVVGAMARDLVLVHGFNAKIERGTRDVDFGINVENWEQFKVLQKALSKLGFNQDENSIHKFTRMDNDDLPWEIDIIPFGKIVDKLDKIYWPPDGCFEINVTGFNEALQHTLQVIISEEPKLSIPVASSAGMILLKLIAWFDRAADLRKKDATDIKYLIDTYVKIPEVFDSIYNGGFAEKQEWDLLKASAAKLGSDLCDISSNKTQALLKSEIFSNDKVMNQLAREMCGGTNADLDECLECLKLLGQEILLKTD